MCCNGDSLFGSTVFELVLIFICLFMEKEFVKCESSHLLFSEELDLFFKRRSPVW